MEFRNCVENRRSIRSFRPDPVRREDILYCLAAADLGLGSCIMSTIRNKKQLQDLLGIPQGQEICLVVALGYPDGDPAASRERLSLEEICCFNPGIPAERPDDSSRS